MSALAVTLTRDARRLLVAAAERALSEVWTWQLGLYPDAEEIAELRRHGLVECRHDAKRGRTWFRLTDDGARVALTPEPAHFREQQPAGKALPRSGGRL